MHKFINLRPAKFECKRAESEAWNQLRTAATATGAVILHWLLALANELYNIVEHCRVATGNRVALVEVAAHGNEVAVHRAYCIFKYAEHVSASQRLSGCLPERPMMPPTPLTPPPSAVQMSTTSVPPLFGRAVQQCDVASFSYTNTNNCSMHSCVCKGYASVRLSLFRKLYCSLLLAVVVATFNSRGASLGWKVYSLQTKFAFQCANYGNFNDVSQYLIMRLACQLDYLEVVKLPSAKANAKRRQKEKHLQHLQRKR